MPIFQLAIGGIREIYDMTDELWLPIPGYEGQYEFSNKYRVRRLAREAEHGKGEFKRNLGPKFLSVTDNNGYLVAYLCRPGIKNKSKKFYVEAAVETNFGLAPQVQDVANEVGEEWLPIAGYEGLYEISNIGRVKSVGWYVNGGKRRRYARPYIRTNGTSTNDYPKVELAKRGKIKTVSIHRLVAIAFVPNPFNLPVVHHKDENRTNPRADNLEWTTRGINVQDWFDRRRLTVNTDTIGLIEKALAEGRDHAEILALL